MDQLYFIVTTDDIPLLDAFILYYYKGLENSATTSLLEIPFSKSFNRTAQLEIVFRRTGWVYSRNHTFSTEGLTLGDLDILRYPERYPELLI